jgi:hypothetical protein
MRTWSVNGRLMRLRWTGAFRLSDDDRDIAWVEPGGSVQIVDDAWFFTTGVELHGRADGTVERVYHRRGFQRAYEPEGRSLLESTLLNGIRTQGMFAGPRVARLLARGGWDAVVAEIRTMPGESAKRLYYSELLRQGSPAPAQVNALVGEALTSLQGEHERASFLVSVSRRSGLDESTTLAAIDVARSIRNDVELRRVLANVVPERPSPKIAAAALAAGVGIESDSERAAFLLALLSKGGLTPATRTAFFDLARGIRSSYEHSRVLRAVASTPGVPEEILAEALKNVQLVGQDHERRQVLMASMARQPASPRQVGGLLDAASGLRSASERAAFLVEFARSNRLADDTAVQFFPLVADISSSYEQQRVLKTVLALPQLSDAMMAGVLTAAASIPSASERADVLVTAVRKQPFSAATRELYLKAADGVRSQSEQTRAYAELVRVERSRR